MAGKIKSIRIHPGIGIARLGNRCEFYIGPESPGTWVDPGGSNVPRAKGRNLRDGGARLKRQAQRYRIYAYGADDEVVAELTSDSSLVRSVDRRVHVRNMKAANYAFQGAYLFDPESCGIRPSSRE